ncbi:MAG TPA: LarC family nickel insertion protein [Solirubrobacterales bacterium]|nr:LarC family nickel insertion protein [Solirubrobacterales bacterium]
MPRTLVFDCFSGIAGDMTLAALCDAGASLDDVRLGLASLDLPPFALALETVTRGGISAKYLRVHVSEERIYQPAELRARVNAGILPPRVRERALAAIDALVSGEAAAHATEHPHLHEAGGVDALIDIVGTMLALEDLDVGDAFCPVVAVGSGTITRSAHGVIPAGPGPAAARILQSAGFPMRFVEASHELVTPTGAAILAAVAKPGPCTLEGERQGTGAGTFDPASRPNALRVFIGQPVQAGPAPAREVVELAANIDDMPAALLANARDRLLEEGALDAWLEPIAMKKGRAATKLCALVPTAEESRFADLFLRETTTLGVRATTYRRYEASRHVETFESSLGPVRLKVSEHAGLRRVTPEFDDIKRLAAEHNLPALEVSRRLALELDPQQR